MPSPIPTISLSVLQAATPTAEAEVSAAISQSFGPNAPGLLLISGLDESRYSAPRLRLFSAARNLASLSDDHLRALERPQVDYAFGWSRGRERFKGVVDSMKGSFYANPLTDTPAGEDHDLVRQYPHYMSPNVWPDHPSCADLQPALKSLGSYISEIAALLAHHCDLHVRNILGPSYPFQSLERSLRHSKAAKARLLNYFPAPKIQPKPDSDSLWCGYHNDHGTLTALLPAQFYNSTTRQPLQQSPDPASGLYVQRRDTDAPEKVHIPSDCVAFQIGECAQIMTGGVLRATPHGVQMPSTPDSQGVARVTLAVFFNPNPWDALDMPKNYTSEQKNDALFASRLVPPLNRGRYMPGESFSDFASKTFSAYREPDHSTSQ